MCGNESFRKILAEGDKKFINYSGDILLSKNTRLLNRAFNPSQSQ